MACLYWESVSESISFCSGVGTSFSFLLIIIFNILKNISEYTLKNFNNSENIFQKGEEAIPPPPQGWGFPCLKIL